MLRPFQGMLLQFSLYQVIPLHRLLIGIKTIDPALIQGRPGLYPNPPIIPDETSREPIERNLRLLALVIVLGETVIKMHALFYPHPDLFRRFRFRRLYPPLII